GSKEYHLPSHPFLRKAVESFPLKDCNGLPELFVSDVKNRRVGQIDLLNIINENSRIAIINDYKTDANITKNIAGHFNQLSHYAHILMAHGWQIPELIIWNYTDSWTQITSPVLPLKSKK